MRALLRFSSVASGSRCAASAWLCALLIHGAMTIPVLAQSTPPLVNPGLWEITPQKSGSAGVSYRQCFSRGDLDDLKMLLPHINGGGDCPQVRLEAGNGVMTWVLNCPLRELVGAGRYELQPASIDGAVNLTEGPSKSATTLTIAARHAGACTTQ